VYTIKNLFEGSGVAEVKVMLITCDAGNCVWETSHWPMGEGGELPEANAFIAMPQSCRYRILLPLPDNR
jgi:hypothetical protein